MTKYLVIANGPFLARDTILEAIQAHVIVALDGAADKLLALNIRPDVILGDFDSIHPDTQAYWGITQDFQAMTESAAPYKVRDNVLIVPAKDQRFTDLSKAIRYCDQQQAEEISIICGTGGREDLHEANKLVLQDAYHKQRPIFLHSTEQTLRWATNEVVILQGDIGDYCGFVSQPGSYADSEGLTYPCQHTTVSLCNRLSAPTARLTITGSALIIMPTNLQTLRKKQATPYVVPN